MNSNRFFANNTMPLCFIRMVFFARDMALLYGVDNAAQLVQLITTKLSTELPAAAKKRKRILYHD